MSDPALLPWWLVWAGLVIAVSGGVLALHGIGQRRPSWVADLGGAVVALGVLLMLGTTLTNGVGAMAYWLNAKAQEVVRYQSPDH